MAIAITTRWTAGQESDADGHSDDARGDQR